MLTSGFKLVVLLGLEDRMRDPQPRVMLPQLGDQVVGYKSHRPRQSVQHDGHKGLDKVNERNMMKMNKTKLELVFKLRQRSKVKDRNNQRDREREQSRISP